MSYMRNGNLLKSCVSEICVKQIHVNQEIDVCIMLTFFNVLNL